MTNKIFTVYDSKVEAYLTPFTMRTLGEAVRAFTELVNDPKTQFNKYPGDYTLFEIATFNLDTGTITPHSVIINHGLAVEYLHKSAIPVELPLNNLNAGKPWSEEWKGNQ